MHFNSKLIVNLLAITPVFAYIDQPCNAGIHGKGVCIKSSDCNMYDGQDGSITKYSGSAPNWPCPDDPDDVICCVKKVTILRDGKTKKKGRCLNTSQCITSTVSTSECPGSQRVKLCLDEPDTPIVNTCTYQGNTYKCMNPNNCSGTVVSGLCPGGADNKCCVTSPPKTSNKCTYQGKEYDCMNPNNCNGKVVSGLCPGGADNKCCVPAEPKIKCPTSQNPDFTKSGNPKITEALPEIFGSEGLCGNDPVDSGNYIDGELGYTCMGITPQTGWSNINYFEYAKSRCGGDKAMFVKCAFDLDRSKFQRGAEMIYTDIAVEGKCNDLPQPAFYVCLDAAVNHGPYWTTLSSIGSKDGKTFGLEINEKSRNYYYEIVRNNPSKEKYLQGWLNRCTKRQNYCNDYCYN